MFSLRSRIFAAAFALAFLSACADDSVSPLAMDATSGELNFALEDEEAEAVPAVIDLTDAEDEREILDIELLTPEAATGIGTGSLLVITIPDAGRFGCSANFLWRTPARLYLGSAGHCFLPGGAIATHGENADYDASGVIVEVCVDDCPNGFRSGATLTGRFVQLGTVAYARQRNPENTTGVGHDFGVVEVPRRIEESIRAEMPVWGGPTGTDVLELGKQACHYGHGVVTGETLLTKGRTGVGGGTNDIRWSGTFYAAFGDSGSGLVACDADDDGIIRGAGAIGVLTHLGASLEAPGVIFGTTHARAVEMAREGRLRLTLVLP